MRNYLVVTPVRGLPRFDRSREPVGAGEVIMLPSAKATELGIIGAVKPSDENVTVSLDWPDDVENVGSLPVFKMDHDNLVGAIEALGGIVFFVGEGLPDSAEDVLGDFSNDQLLGELITRLGEGRLQLANLSGRQLVVLLKGVSNALLVGEVARRINVAELTAADIFEDEVRIIARILFPAKDGPSEDVSSPQPAQPSHSSAPDVEDGKANETPAPEEPSPSVGASAKAARKKAVAK